MLLREFLFWVLTTNLLCDIIFPKVILWYISLYHLTKGENPMNLSQSGDKMIYIQLADWIEDEILAGTFAEEAQIPSVADLSANFKINHMTALKGIAVLTDSGIIYKKRGVGMFVASGAVKKLRDRRRREFCGKYLKEVSAEAKKLGIGFDELTEMMKGEYYNE